MGDDLIDIAMSYIENDEPIRTTWQPVSVSPYIAVEEPEGYRPTEVVVPTPDFLSTGLNDIFSSSIFSSSQSYQFLIEEERQAFERFVKAEKKRQEKENNYKQFREFTRILERTYYN